jgi:hypothetical protein
MEDLSSKRALIKRDMSLEEGYERVHRKIIKPVL